MFGEKFDISLGYILKVKCKHREKAIDRLSHSPETILKDVFTKYTVNDFSNVLCNINAKEKCYIISQNH